MIRAVCKKSHGIGPARIFFLISLLSLSGPGCTVPREDGSTSAGKQAILYKVNAALTSGDCTSAIIAIEPLYNSSNSDDEVRRLRASAHACKAGINFFPLLGELASGGFSGSGLATATGLLYKMMARIFPATSTDGKAQSSFYASDALMAWLRPGTVIGSSYKISSDPYNIGSLSVNDHTDESNLYLFLVSMSTLGTLSRMSDNVDVAGGTYALQAPGLPWTTLATLDEQGCGYAAGMLNLTDSLASIGASFDALSGLASSLSGLNAVFDWYCQQACISLCPTLGAAGACPSTCPLAIRHRNGCDRATSTTENINACAAVGVVRTVNLLWGTIDPGLPGYVP